MNKPSLTIAIPTYNRSQQLADTLSVILPQVVNDDRVYLLILDNHSEVPASEVLTSLGIHFPGNRVQVVRNRVNIGANANIMRCFEFCETQWLWVLGDDDAPVADSVGIILGTVDNSLSYIYYTVPAIQKPLFMSEDADSVTGTGFEALVDRFGGAIDQLAFLSASVFNMEFIRPYILEGYLVVNTGIPHLAMLLKNLSADGRWRLSKQTIADYVWPENSELWGVIYIAYAMPALFSIATGPEEVRIIRNCIVQKWRIKPKGLLSSMAVLHQARSQRDLLKYLYGFMSNLYAPSVFKNFLAWKQWRIIPFDVMYFSVRKGKVRKRSWVNQGRR